MFFAHYENTMRNARPKFVEPEVVRSIEQIRAEKRVAAAELCREQARALAERLEQQRFDAAQHALSLQAVQFYRVLDIRNARTPVRSIVERVGTFHDISFDAIVGPRRDRKTVAARYDAIKAVHSVRPDLTLQKIGWHFNRDHTSVLHALGRVKKNQAASKASNGAEP